MIAERPNVGYDFGGYRDGVRLMREAGVAPEALVLLNDSIWWPVFPGDDMLARMERAGSDLVGTVHHRPRARRGSARVRYLHSYFYWFGAAAAASQAFARFWDGYRLSGLKYDAIRRGELRLTQALADGGLTVGALWSGDALLARLDGSDAATVETTLRYATFKHDAARIEAERLLAEPGRGADWHARATGLLAAMFAEAEFQVAAPWAALRLEGMGYVKKSLSEPATSQYHRMRDAVLAAVAAGDLPRPVPAVEAEIAARQARGGRRPCRLTARKGSRAGRGEGPPGLVTYVINLARSEGRREAMARRLDALGLPFTRLDAVDGRAEWDRLAASVDETRFRRNVGRAVMRARDRGLPLPPRGVARPSLRRGPTRRWCSRTTWCSTTTSARPWTRP